MPPKDIHVILYHLDQGQAGAQSIEDGAAIGILFSRMPQIPKDCPADLDAEIARRLSAFEDVRKARASIMQIYSNAGQDEAEKIRDEATRFLGPGVKVPSQYPRRCNWCTVKRLTSNRLSVLANQAEFHEFNFGYDVVKESEAVLARL